MPAKLTRPAGQPPGDCPIHGSTASRPSLRLPSELGELVPKSRKDFVPNQRRLFWGRLVGGNVGRIANPSYRLGRAGCAYDENRSRRDRCPSGFVDWRRGLQGGRQGGAADNQIQLGTLLYSGGCK